MLRRKEADPDRGLAGALQAFKLEAADRTRYCQARADTLVEHVAEGYAGGEWVFAVSKEELRYTGDEQVRPRPWLPGSWLLGRWLLGRRLLGRAASRCGRDPAPRAAVVRRHAQCASKACTVCW